MRYFLKCFNLFFTLITFFSCQKDDTTNNSKALIDEVSFTKFSIENNSPEGTYTSAELKLVGSPSISQHGVIVLFKHKEIEKQSDGELKSNKFKSVIVKNLIKDTTYSVFPYIHYDNKYVYGDTLQFKSNINININIDEITPKKGFIYDTIKIKGNNFCKSYLDFKNIVSLSGTHTNIVLESDSLIKAVVTPFIKESLLTPLLKTCNIETKINENFLINEPKLDSITSKETYVDEKLTIYGENFHSNISEVYIDGKPTKVNKYKTDIDKLEITIPRGLPSGLLDMKIKVLDRTISKDKYFNSTSPYISELSKKETGFLDTLTIKGNYFKQPNRSTQVIIGGENQKIINASKTSITVLINRYFSIENPKLVLKIGEFELTRNITMLPPQIKSIDKDFYNLEDDTVILKTKYFLGSSSNISVGNTGIAMGPFNSVKDDGTLIIPLNNWLNSKSLYPKYTFDSKGEIKIQLQTAYGSSSKNIKIFEPKIKKINKTEFIHNEAIELEGENLGYEKVSNIYIDDVLVDNPNNSSYYLRNKMVRFEVPKNLLSGTHKLKISTGEQTSNEIDFELKAITVSPNSITPNQGTRKNTYSITGNNLQDKSAYRILTDADYGYCLITSNTDTKVEFQLPYRNPLKNITKIRFEYGKNIKDAGQINSIEPFELVSDYTIHPNYNSRFSEYFEYDNNFYFTNGSQIYNYSISSKNWVLFEENCNIQTGLRKNISIANDKLYAVNDSVFNVYDLKNKTWLENIPISSKAKTFLDGSVYGNSFYYIKDEGSQNYTFNKYNLDDLTDVKLNQPIKLPNYYSYTSEIFYSKNGKIFLDFNSDNIFMYDISNDTWEDIGHPRAPYLTFYANNLYYYKNKLYLSGGLGNKNVEYNIYEYDFSTKTWTEKTPMLRKLRDHAVFGKDDFLYIMLGRNEFNYDNTELMKYNLNLDPH